MRLEKNTFHAQLSAAGERSRKLFDEKDVLVQQRLKDEREAKKIFTLYEMTKEIIPCLDEKEAFIIFKRKLAENVNFSECVLIDSLEESGAKYRKNNYFIFTLQGKERRIGYLVFKDLFEEDRQKVAILGHQFALALRRVILYKEIEKVAITDSLTEVHTRRYFMERLREEISRSASRKIKMSLVMIDVDHFKKLNDQYGHLAGDQILREVGQLIKENIREIDIAGRFGGEEFCVVLPDTDPQGAKLAAERIRQAVAKKAIQAYDAFVRITVSAGVASFPDHAKERDELIEKADGALYLAKEQGRDRVSLCGT